MKLAAIAFAVVTTLSFATAQGFDVTEFGPNCGPVATGAVTPVGHNWRFAFTVSGARPRTSVMNILAVTPNLMPIEFGPSCMLLSDIAFNQIHRTDATGSYTWSHAIAGGFRGDAYIQFAEITFDSGNNLVVRTTNGLHMAPR